jgi:hypothetical protein
LQFLFKNFHNSFSQNRNNGWIYNCTGGLVPQTMVEIVDISGGQQFTCDPITIEGVTTVLESDIALEVLSMGFQPFVEALTHFLPTTARLVFNCKETPFSEFKT